MIRAIVAVCQYDETFKQYLKPYRFEVPSFLPSTRYVLKTMANDIDLGEEITFDGDLWIVDGDPWPDDKGFRRMVDVNLDWSSTEVLRYDFEEKDLYGDRRHDPWSIWRNGADITIRAKDLEPFIVGDHRAEKYAKKLKKDQWAGFTEEELIQNPCWMFYYAKNVCGGRLPEVLDNAMTMLSFQNSEDPWIKRYFGTKKYRRRNRKALASIGQVA